MNSAGTTNCGLLKELFFDVPATSLRGRLVARMLFRRLAACSLQGFLSAFNEICKI